MNPRDVACGNQAKDSGNSRRFDHLDAFIRDQELFGELFEKSTLPKFTVDVSDNDIAKAVETVADWMERTGGLTLAS